MLSGPLVGGYKRRTYSAAISVLPGLESICPASLQRKRMHLADGRLLHRPPFCPPTPLRTHPPVDAPPEVGSIHHGRVVSVRPFGAFVELPGYRRQALVHHSQVRFNHVLCSYWECLFGGLVVQLSGCMQLVHHRSQVCDVGLTRAGCGGWYAALAATAACCASHRWLPVLLPCRSSAHCCSAPCASHTQLPLHKFLTS